MITGRFSIVFHRMTVVVAFGVTTVVLVLCLRSSPGQEPALRPRPELSGGAAIQRQRIDTFIQATALMSFDELVAALDEYSESYELASLASLSHGTLNPGVILTSVLSDRRVAKIYEQLLADDADEAARKSKAIFASKLKLHVEQTRKWRNGELPDPRNVMSGVHLHAATAGLFLCSQFCDTKSVLQFLDDWHAAFPDDARKGPGILMSALPEALFELNVLLLVARRDGMSSTEMNSRLSRLGDELGMTTPTTKLLRFYKWNAHTNNTDSTRLHRGVAADDQSVLTEIDGFDNWPDPQLPLNTILQDQLIRTARSWLTPTP